jgi:hypothetical protein
MDRPAFDDEVDSVIRDDRAVALRNAAQREVRPARARARAGLRLSLVAYLNQRG